MSAFTIASFNVKNLIGADKEYYKFQTYTPEEYAWKKEWMAGQLLTMNADIIGFQEVFEESALRDVIVEADRMGEELNERSLPDRTKKYRNKAIFRKLGFDSYAGAAVTFAPNSADEGVAGERRPGVALVSRFGFAEKPRIIQDLDAPFEIPFPPLRGMETASDAGFYRLRRLSRPILITRIPVGGQVITVIVCHLKSKLGEFLKPDAAAFAPEEDLTHYDPLGRAMGSLRSALRRMAEAWMVRHAVLEELGRGRPVVVMGDFNDGENAVSSEIVAGELPFRNYSWMLRHDAKSYSDRYSDAEDLQIKAAVEAVRMHSAEREFVRHSLRDMVYTSAFGGVYESIDQILWSRHFSPDNPRRIGEMEYFSVFNDHITDGLHPEAPYNKLASDHGQIMAHMRLNDPPI